MLIQIVSLYMIDVANTQNARLLVGDALQTSMHAFRHRISTKNNSLIQAGSLLSADFAFKTAWASGNRSTIRSALENQRRRIGADIVILLSLEGSSAGMSGVAPERWLDAQGHFAFPDLLAAAQGKGDTSGIVAVDRHLYSLIIVPLLTPVPAAWIVLGFEINQPFIDELERDSNSKISIVGSGADGWSVYASTLDEGMRARVKSGLDGGARRMDEVFDMPLDNDSYISLLGTLSEHDGAAIYTLLQRSRHEAMAPYYRLRGLLVFLFVLALLATAIGGAAIANSVTRPIRVLAGFAREIMRGVYTHEVPVRQRDEVGQLSEAFNDMSRGLYERDRVRDLLGKVMSADVAEELLSRDLQLGGEERELTIMFTDLRNFTGISETLPPAKLLEILNNYLTRMTAIIDRHGGVVDKYIGDAIMALFGAPLPCDDHAARAVRCAIEMQEALAEFNVHARQNGWPELEMGIGINTALVVVGNMGSEDRLNYTAIGDGVNLAARLESVTKDLGAPIVVSERVVAHATDMTFTFLDRIPVKGKRDPVAVYAPASLAANPDQTVES